MSNIKKMITASPDDSINDILQKMQINFVKHIVIEVNNKPVGIVTERDINKFLENDKTVRALEEISIKQVMKKDPVTITEGSTGVLSQAAKLMTILKIGSVIVVEPNGNLVEIITKRDITKVYGVIYGSKFKVKDYMSSKIFTCRESDSLKFALNMINKNKISRLIVTSNTGKPIGVMTANTFLVHCSYFTKGKTLSRDYLLPSNSEKMSVGNLIQNDVLSVSSEEDLSVAAQKMVKNHIHGLPVVDNADKLVGVVSNSDIVEAFVKVPITDELLQKYSELY